MGIAIEPSSLESVTEAARVLIAEAGFSDNFTIQPIPGGANNRVFRVEGDEETALLKAYFQHPDDPRDRLGAEFAFTSFAWAHGIHRLPRPLACDSGHHLGLYEFVWGRKLLADEINRDFIEQAIAFYHELNHDKAHEDAAALPVASEACFTISDHLITVERRLRQLSKMDIDTTTNRKAANFIQDNLLAVWQKVRQSVREQAAAFGFGLDKTITRRDRCLSPSDFGFHNAICECGDRLRFIDFEYAGWDDPAKLVCDFFCQPTVPVPLSYFDSFAQSVAANLSDPEMHLRRFGLLLPVYQIKWCCIMLNDFLPAGHARRDFAQSAADQDQRKAAQLQKAQDAVRKVQWRKP